MGDKTPQFYKFIVSYDGTDYCGWQEQSHDKTVAGTIKRTFIQVFEQDIALLGASRTDAGVHALGQVVACRTALNLEPAQLKNAWNSKLPRDIVIREMTRTTPTYNPHHGIIEKEYTYTIALERPLPFQARYQWHYRRQIVIEKLTEALTLFVGTHDFRSFCCSEYTGNTTRIINAITLSQQSPDTYTITFTAPGFLRYMIRRIVGACLTVSSHRHLSINDLIRILQAKNPEHTLESAPPQGLVLVAIRYQDSPI